MIPSYKEYHLRSQSSGKFTWNEYFKGKIEHNWEYLFYNVYEDMKKFIRKAKFENMDLIITVQLIDKE
jgi:hypothetical protein